MTLCTVSCWSEGDEWIVYVHELDRSAAAHRVSQVSTVAHELVDAFGRGEQNAAAFTYQLLEEPPPIDVDATRAANLAGAAADVESATVRNGLAWRMAVQGVPFAQLGQGGGAPAGWIDTLSAKVTKRVDGGADGPVAPRTATSPPRHEAHYHRGADDLVAATAAFVRDGLSGDEAIMLAVPADRLHALTSALGNDVLQLESVIIDDADDNPARLLPRIVSFVERARAAGRTARIVHEIPLLLRHPQLRVEWLLHEQLLDLALAGPVRVHVRCLLDLTTADVERLEEVAAGHPILVDGTRVNIREGSDATGRVSDSFHTPLPAPDAAVDEISFDPETLADVRQFLISRALAAGIDQHRTSDLALAAWEIARDVSTAVGGVPAGSGPGRSRTPSSARSRRRSSCTTL